MTPSRLRDLDEAGVLAEVLPLLGSAGNLALLGPGDDAAVLAAPSGSVAATTDSMVRGVDWRDDWSSPWEVGVKLVMQNVADVAAMGAVPAGLLLTIAADPATELAWLRSLCEGVGHAAAQVSAGVVGGDVSGAPEGVVVLGMTALGDLEDRPPVTRGGARPGDVVAVAGSLGWSGGGLALYLAGRTPPQLHWDSDEADKAVATLMWSHRQPTAAWSSGPVAAEAGATAMLDVSDGLVRDAGRIARASGVGIDLDGAALRAEADGPLTVALGVDEALRQVLGGGEEHSLLACFPDEASVPQDRSAPWRVIGRVVEPTSEPGVTLDGQAVAVTGWDHFAR